MLEWNYTYISSITNDEFTRYYLLMNNEKQKKVAAYKNIDDKKRTIAGEILARKMISSFCNVFPEDVFFELGLHGKPYIKNLDVEFNISHSDEMVVCASPDAAWGIVVYDYICMYLDKLADGSIPHERRDRRVFRLIWEHKKCMLGRIKAVEKQYGWDNELSSDYEEVVKLADKARFIYSKFVIKYSNLHLERIQVLLMQMKSLEVQILGKLLKSFEGELNAQTSVE